MHYILLDDELNVDIVLYFTINEARQYIIKLRIVYKKKKGQKR